MTFPGFFTCLYLWRFYGRVLVEFMVLGKIQDRSRQYALLLWWWYAKFVELLSDCIEYEFLVVPALKGILLEAHLLPICEGLFFQQNAY